jgi:hypothetical protein
MIPAPLFSRSSLTWFAVTTMYSLSELWRSRPGLWRKKFALVLGACADE